MPRPERNNHIIRNFLIYGIFFKIVNIYIGNHKSITGGMETWISIACDWTAHLMGFKL